MAPSLTLEFCALEASRVSDSCQEPPLDVPPYPAHLTPLPLCSGKGTTTAGPERWLSWQRHFVGNPNNLSAALGLRAREGEGRLTLTSTDAPMINLQHRCMCARVLVHARAHTTQFFKSLILRLNKMLWLIKIYHEDQNQPTLLL